METFLTTLDISAIDDSPDGPLWASWCCHPVPRTHITLCGVSGEHETWIVMARDGASARRKAERAIGQLWLARGVSIVRVIETRFANRATA